VDQAGHRLDRLLMPQVALYHDGVGTEATRWFALLTGATGWGLSRNVKQLYGELARVYAPGDKIFLFGFSRGAFTVRTLAGLIHACGILDLSRYPTNAAFNRGVRDAYHEYRQLYNSWATRLFHETKKLTPERVGELRSRFSVRVPEFDDAASGPVIAFIGVWDTVDAVGLPIAAAEFVNRVVYAFKFPDRTLNLSVAHACHALALDEQRESFAPVLWNELKTEQPERIEQVWFSGVHSNVGGGYPRQGMSLVALDWMMSKAELHGLRFVPAERLLYRYHADVDDKLYDSRAGIGVLYRWQPRDVQRLCEANGVPPRIHRSVFERIARNTEGYAPGSLPSDAAVISTNASAPAAEAIRALVREHHGSSIPLLRREARTQLLGRYSYWMFAYGVLAVAGLTIGSFVADAVASTERGQQVVRSLASVLARMNGLERVLQTLWLWRYRVLGPWLVVTFWIGIWVDHQLDRTYSEFWHRDDMRLRLRRLIGLG
jgi:hypothetical protein